MAIGSNGGKNAYKKRGLSRKNRFASNKMNMGAAVMVICVIATFIFAIILGNILGEKAHSVSTNPQGSVVSPEEIILPSVEKVPPKEELNAYFVNFSGVDPDVETLSDFTKDARDKGNALFFEITDQSGKIVYTSEATNQISMSSHPLKLSRIEGHFAYYVDYVVGHYQTSFSSTQAIEKRAEIQYNDILILKEITSKACDEIIISFSSPIDKRDLIYYQSYLLNIKLALPEVSIGVALSEDLLTNSDASGVVAAILEYADYFFVDLSDLDAKKMSEFFGESVYYFTKYKSVVVLSESEELEEQINMLKGNKINNFIIK